MSLVIAGERSGVGKTTITLSLLASLCKRSDRVQSFKVGPDYIDPMFHQHVTGLPSFNLDPILTSEAYIQQCFEQYTRGVEYALVEGVMGLFDGASGIEDRGSTAHVAKLLNLPVILVVDCSRLSRSIAAIVHGYCTLDPGLQVVGVILNRVGSDRHLELLTAALEPLAIPILGVLRRQDALTIPDRHLGLVPTGEFPGLSALVDRLTYLADTCFNWDLLLPLLQVKNSNSIPPSPFPIPHSRVPIAIAQDAAFNFYYQDNLDILTRLGADLIPWSPLQDNAPPPQAQGFYFGGGFPEVFAEQLAANGSARKAVQRAIQRGIPTYAECGGLMYLGEAIVDFAGQSWPMVGILPTIAKMSDRLKLGYRQATVLRETPLMPAGKTVWGHEFHRSELLAQPSEPLYALQGYHSSLPIASEGWHLYQVHASYVHLHFGIQLDLPRRFLAHCHAFPPS
ncbi:MAG: cobyrinate a,c-diamide synthase [Leptolyngbyaceae cyanobacterium bins.59]|nr:cobyrinate a,c-diamide synthase [Leptolyngbyaceae cyanobacterium bins.59]